MKVLGSKMTLPKGVLGLKHRNTQRKAFKNLLLQNLLAEILEIWYVALSSGALPNMFKMGQGILGLLVKYIKNLLQAQLLEIWYIALPCGP